MSDFKEAIDKTEELARKIWLAGLGAYGQGLDNVQSGYDKMNDQARTLFDELVERGEKIESEAKEKLEETNDMLKDASDKLKSRRKKLKTQGEKLLNKTEQLKDDALKINIVERLEEIRNKVADKLVLPELPKFDRQETLDDLSKRLEELKKQHHEGIAQKAIEYKHSTIRGVEQHCEQFGLSVQQLADLANQYRSKPVHPSQLYAVIDAFLISWILSTIFYYRQRHGVVLGWFLIMYSIARIALESIRADNPLDTFGGITISQSISLCTFIAGVLWLALMYRLPKFSPRAVPVVYEDENESAPPKAKPKNA